MQTNDYKTIRFFSNDDGESLAIFYDSNRGLDGAPSAQILADKTHLPALTNAKTDVGPGIYSGHEYPGHNTQNSL
jgi:hypothetical protein